MDNDEMRLPPQNVEAEQSVLGAIFLSVTQQDALAEAAQYLQPTDFYRQAHRLIFKTMLDLDNDGRPIDPVTLQDRLASEGNLENIGGVAYLAELAGSVPTAANIGYYAQIVKEKAVLRGAIDVMTTGITDAFTEEQNSDDLLANITTKLEKIAENKITSDFLNIQDVLNEAFREIEANSQNNEIVTGLPSGYAELDKLTTGFHPGELIIIAARPAMGKTAFVLNIAQNVAVKSGAVVAMFELEMSASGLVQRLLASQGSINSNHMRTGNLETDEWQNLMVAMQTLAQTKLFIDDTPGIKISDIRAKLRRLEKEQGQIGLVVIDYLQLIESNNHENRQQEVSDISRALKKLSKELNAPVIALSQLSRSVEQRQDKRPVLSDIRESGSIEQDADIVAFLYRDDYYDRDDNDSDDSQTDPRDTLENDAGPIEVIIEKNRSGARGTAKLLFIKSYNKFSSLAYVDEPQS
ncbi:replicative DNA helicase [Weissella beninensis]|uniref:Replicative DNA helicase n=1 Tax=Periweissella beninensis TaxID=504936 RepID=A0ABT0VH94_9LACO|nr:replicative DNA helicase [Periweissella beninensis]MBM7544963.1 replicative DNA helicase [Periweissella beninensis]MCM2437208.1 replicative DNA helicase [Periweissella beninensis]